MIRKLIVAPDSFKGTISAERVSDIISEELLAADPRLEILRMPIADGGEGSLKAIMSVTGGELFTESVIGPGGDNIDASYGIAADGTAIIEMAESSGITRQKELHPMSSSTYGLGQLIKAALDKGARNFILCVGGSATTDGGCGMAAALGAEFLSPDEMKLMPCGQTLSDIIRIDLSCLDSRIAESHFTVMCDVENPLFGPDGAAYVYGPQKGADPEQQAILDEGLSHLNDLLMKMGFCDFGNYPGAGAAGGLGAGCIAFLGAELKKGSEEILRLFGFEEEAERADLIITGEGAFDFQSLQGKVFSGIRKYAGNKPVVVICGINRCSDDTVSSEVRVFAACDYAKKPEDSIADPEKYLRMAASAAAKYITSL